MQLIRVNLL